MKGLKVRTLFSGIGSPEIALRDLKIPFEVVDFCEVDKYAVQSYCVVHGMEPSKNLGDITKVWGRNLPYADLLVWGFPCTDISVAGKQKGIIEGETRSGLYYEGLRILRETKPKYSIIENVKNLVGKQFKEQFKQMLADIEELGYNNYWKVLNAKDYGIPQNRERVFIVSIRREVDNGKFEFPLGFDNGIRLKDLLESEVDEKYYISQEKTEKLIQSLTLTSEDRHGVLQVGELDIKGMDCIKRVYSDDGVSPMLTTMEGGNRQPKVMVKEAPMPELVGGIGEINFGKQYRQGNRVYDADKTAMCLLAQPVGNAGGNSYLYKVAVKEATKQGYAEATVGDSINIQFPNSETRRGRVGHGVAQTLETSCNQAVLVSTSSDYVNKKYGEFIDKNGYMPEMFNPYNCAEITDNAPTLTAQGDSITKSGTVLKYDGYRIRKLTPKECWRLMGFTDEDFQKAADAGVSNSQLYKQAGNSIVSNVLYYIFKNLLQTEIAQATEDNKALV